MNDEERLIEAAATAWYGEQPSELARQFARKHLDMLRVAGITVTPPPAPEPTYTVTFSKSEWDVVRAATSELRFNLDANVGIRDRATSLFSRLERQSPDPEPGR